jgi:hypothetical protein
MTTLLIFLSIALFCTIGLTIENWWSTPTKAGRHVTDDRSRATGREITLATMRMVLRTALGKNRPMPSRSAHALTLSRRVEAAQWSP